MTTDKASMVAASTIRSDQIRRFERLATTWLNSQEPMRSLIVINALRLD